MATASAAETPEPPDSPYDPADALIAETPEGYDPPTTFDYPIALLGLGSLLLFGASSAAFGALLWAVQGMTVFDAFTVVSEADGVITVTVDMGRLLATFAGAVLVTTVVHEWIHGLALRRYGFDVLFGFAPHMGAFYAAAFHQFVPRDHYPPVAVAPLLLITLAGIPLLAVPVPWVASFAYLALVFNATGAVGDLYAFWRIRRYPPGTLLYDSDIRHSYVFRPTER